MNPSFIIFLAIIAVTYCGSGTDWEYEGVHGPNHWYEDYPECSGVMQSPIAINSSLAVYDHSLLQFGFKGFASKSSANMTMKNNGHTVQVDFNDTSLRTHGGGLTGGYKPVQFHFHWGSDNTKGSEHVINTQHYPMEMHVVHYSERFSSIADAMDKPDGLMVLGFFFEIGRHNIHFQEVFKYLETVAHKDDITAIPPVVMERLTPIDLIHYYRYRGSLTTPPCYESVVWTVFTQPIEISEEQMNTFRHKIKKTPLNVTEEDLTNDFRPVQAINGRTVYSSFPLPVQNTPPPATVPPIIVCGNSNNNSNSGNFNQISKLLIFLYILVYIHKFKI